MLEEITFKKLIRFVLPSILMMVFISIYTAVDSVFIARLVGTDALAGLNVCMPLYSIAFACGIMFATGGGAIITLKLGRREIKDANRSFTSLLSVGAGFGIIAAIACLLFREPLISALGAVGAIRPHAFSYGIFMMITFPFMIIKVITESILRADGYPQTALHMTIIGGILNIILDYIFMGPLNMGISGAGLGTLLSIALSLPLGLSHFFSDRSTLKLIKIKPDFTFILNTITNGSSEMINEAAIAVSTIIMNKLALKYLGNIGLSAVAVILALNFVNTSIVFGFTTGVSPLLSFNYGRGNLPGINRIIRFSFIFIVSCSVVIFLLNSIGAQILVGIYVDPQSSVFLIAVHGLRLYSIGHLFVGIFLFGTAFFTAFGNGRISAIISFGRSFIVFIIASLTLPAIFGADGIWFINGVTQIVSVCLVFYFMRKYQDKYDYNLSKPGSCRI